MVYRGCWPCTDAVIHRCLMTIPVHYKKVGGGGGQAALLPPPAPTPLSPVHPSTVGAMEAEPFLALLMERTAFQKSVCLDRERTSPSFSWAICSRCLLSLRTSSVLRVLLNLEKHSRQPDSDNMLCQRVADCLSERAQAFHAGMWCLCPGETDVRPPCNTIKDSESRSCKWVTQPG